MCIVYSRHKIESDATLAIMLSQGRTLGRAQDHSWTVTKSSSTRTTCKNEQASKFLKNVRGLPAYWQDQLYDVLAML